MKLNDAHMLYVGTVNAPKVYLGTTQVWPSLSSNTGWRSALYPANLATLPENPLFEADAFLQDFSFAGYLAGSAALPVATNGLIDVTTTPYNADPSGVQDATTALRAALEFAGNNGGGIVYLPPGTYKVSLQDSSEKEVLAIKHNNVILRGAGADQTRIFNDTTAMRSRSIIRASATTGGFFQSGSHSTAITRDLPSPTRIIPVNSAVNFTVGDYISIQHDLTDDWADDHRIPEWKTGARPTAPSWFREITTINHATNEITIDAPIRYYVKVRDNPSVHHLPSHPLTGVGVEHLSIGNHELSGSEWSESSYNTAGSPAYNAHDSWAITFSGVRDGWVRSVNAYKPASNTTNTHLLSNGIAALQCTRVTIADCRLSHPQYGGAGGNGYMYRLQDSSDCLLVRSHADFARHGFVFSHAATSGNVLLACTDSRTGNAVGSGSGYRTAGQGSDHHMHFSHSNLIDSCETNDSWFEAVYRNAGTILHGITSAHGVFWNIRGSGTLNRGTVHTGQARYGYVIGTSGERSVVERNERAADAPSDHVEGEGNGESLSPRSLYIDQLQRRLGHGLLQ